MARTTTPIPDAARSAAGTAPAPAAGLTGPAAGGSPAAAVLAALSASPAGASVNQVAARAGLSVPVTRQALLACEKDGTATRAKGARPGIADTWTPAPAPAGEPASARPGQAHPEAASDEAGPGPAPAGTHDGTGDVARPAPAPAGDGGAEGGTGLDPAVLAGAAGAALALAQAADEAGRALAAGDLDAALAALEAAREQAAAGRRVIRAAASGRSAPATRPGALRDLVEDHLRAYPEAAFTPHQVAKVLTRSAGAVANALDKLTGLGTAELVTDKPRAYRLATAGPAPAGAGGGLGAGTAASAV